MMVSCEKQKVALSEGICSAGGSPSLCAQDMEKAAFLMGGAILSTYRNTYRNRVKRQRAGNAGKQSSLAEGHWRMLCEQDGKTPVLSGLLLRGLHLLSLCIPRTKMGFFLLVLC